MGFGSGGSSTSSIAGASDATLNNPASNEVLGYDSITSMWTNMTPASGSVTSVAGKTGIVTLTKTDVALGNVDNTSDANKPISTATQTALNGKANTSHVHTIANVTSLQTELDARIDKTTVIGFGTGTTLPASAPDGTVFFLYEEL